MTGYKEQQKMALTAEMKAAGRKTPELLAELMKDALDIEIRAIVLDPVRATFAGQVSAKIDGEPTARLFSIANADGKQKTFADVDNLAASVMNLFPQKIAGDLVIKVVGANKLTRKPRVITDIIADAKRTRTKYQDIKVKVDAAVIKVTSEIALSAGWENGTPDEQARFAEMTTQKAGAVAYQEWLASEITRITDAVGA
jgi:hypothetical protein